MDTSERLTHNFYTWETRGRGWQVYDYPIDLEPPFRPFSIIRPVVTYEDEGRVPGWFERFIKSKKSSQQTIQEDPIEDDPYPFHDNAPLRSITFHLHRDYKLNNHSIEHLLLMLSCTEYPVSFEIIADAQAIKVQVVCRNTDSIYIVSQLQVFFPTLSFIEQSNIPTILQDNCYTYISDFGLAEEFMRPLSTDVALDPLTGCLGILNSLENGDYGGVQILFKGTGNPWSEHIVRSIILPNGECFFADAPEMVTLVKDKISCPLFAVSIRVFGQSNNQDKAHTICETLGVTLQQATRSPYNSLIALHDNYPFETRATDIILRRSHRLGMLLNAKELMTLVHPPSPFLISSKFTDGTRKTKAIPKIAQGHELILGYNKHQDIDTPVSVSTEQRMNHIHVIGATGTGKSSLLLNCIIQDIDNNNGVCVLDPHGDLIENTLRYIPEHRHKDVIVVDPSNFEYTLGLNLLSAHSETEKELIASDLVSIFRRLSTSWGDQMNSVFSNAVLAFLESSKGGTLHDLRRFLIEKEFREQFLTTVTDDHCLYYWKKEYPILKTNSIGPILTRLDTFLRPKPIRTMMMQQSGLNFEDILQSGKILLIKLSQGLIGIENSYLLGTLFVTKINQAALARQAIVKDSRNPFFLYIDEFHNFITPSVASMLSGVRKYSLGLILAHQGLSQLNKEDSEIEDALFTNIGTRVCFRVSEDDAKKIANTMSTFTIEDILNQSRGEAIIRLEKSSNDCNLDTYALPQVDIIEAEENKRRCIEASNVKYAIPITETPKIHNVANILEPQQEYHIATETINVEPITTQQEFKEDKVEQYKEQQKKRKEESEHRYLQTLIKKMAESKGYKVLIEHPTPDCKGRVDVSLEKNGQKIACEISNTTTDTWEVHNVQKCLDAGYDQVLVCSSNRPQLQKIKSCLEKQLQDRVLERVFLFQTEELFMWLDSQNISSENEEQKIKGYRVKVNYNTESNNTSERVNRLIMSLIKQPKNEDGKV